MALRPRFWTEYQAGFTHNGAGDLDSLSGMEIFPTNAGGGHVYEMTGLYVAPSNSATGTVDTTEAIYAAHLTI